jgi:hypothetical protein
MAAHFLWHGTRKEETLTLALSSILILINDAGMRRVVKRRVSFWGMSIACQSSVKQIVLKLVSMTQEDLRDQVEGVE